MYHIIGIVKPDLLSQVMLFINRTEIWKVGSRKLYAVKNSELKDKKRSAGVINISSSSDEELLSPLFKRRRIAV